MGYYDDFSYQNSFAPFKPKEEDSDIEIKDLNSLDEESVKIMEKIWINEIKERMNQEELDNGTYH